MTAAWVVGSVVALVAAGAALIVRTRWLQSRTLEKCVALSVVLHGLVGAVCALLGGLAPASRGAREEGPMTMVVVLEADDDTALLDASPAASAPEEPTEEPTEQQAEQQAEALAEAAPTGPAAVVAEAGEPPAIVARIDVTDRATAEPPADLVPLLERVDEPPAAPPPAAADLAATVAPPEPEPAAAAPRDEPAPAVPPLYADRVGARRAAAAAARGGSEATERAVLAALEWLAAAQASDGRWEAARHGAGRGRPAGGQHDGTVGARSDTGVTGLALLAFLGAGSTHQRGPHAEQVARGVRFLLDGQRADGSLAGAAEFFASLYCHGLATLAVAECLALSGDPALRPPLERAVRSTLSAQHPVTGGWRYAAGDRGDTSQLGWQVMVLAAARQAGMGGLDAAEAGARTFLRSVSSGRAGGLAAYRAGEQPSVAMTAEALVCRLFLGLPVDHPAAIEALDLLARHPPDPRRPNAYTWYYATLASFHSGGPQWDRWNRALQTALLPTQHRERGPYAGSWDPDPVWGGHGGRVYATALSALTLEIYYRHAPLHQRGSRIAAAP
jgi:hypothetical protein